MGRLRRSADPHQPERAHREHEGHLRDRDPREQQADRQVDRVVNALTTLTTPVLLPLHGIGGRQDLPLPFGYAVTGAVAAIVVSYVVLGLAWRSSKYRGDASGRPLPVAITRTVDAPWIRWLVRLFGLAFFVYFLMALVFGVDRLTNPSFGVLYILVWVGLV